MEVRDPIFLPARCQLSRPVRVRQAVALIIDGCGRALENIEMLRRGGHFRNHLYARGARSDQACALVRTSQSAFVATIGFDLPNRVGVVPTHARYLGLEKRLRVEVQLAGDLELVIQDFSAGAVFFGRHVAEALEGRHIDISFDVAQDPG
jgi:hypothetical protein